MALATAYGNFAKSTGGAPASQAITGLGFQPKALILWATLQTAAGIAADSEFGVGLVAAGGFHSSAGASEDGQTTSDVYSRHAVKALTLRDVAGTTVAECDLTTMDADGFTLSWTTNNGTAYIIHYLAIGGSDVTDGDAGYFTTATSTGNQAVTGIGFQPDVVLFWGSASIAAPPANFDNRNQYFGVAVSSTQRAASSISSRDAQATTITFRRQLTNKCLAFHSSLNGGTLGEADFVSMDADGFTINWSVAPAGAVKVGYLAIKGGQYYVGSDVQRTSTGTEPTTGVGFLPTGLLMLSCNQAVSGTVDAHERFSIGAASAAGVEGCIWEGDTDNLGTSSTDMSTVTDKVIRLIDTDGPSAADAEADLDSFDGDGFTLDWTTADAVAREFVFLAMGSAGQTLSPGGIASAEAFGSVTITINLTPSGIASLEAFGSAAVSGVIAPSGIASLEAFGAAVISISLLPDGIASLEAFGSASIAVTLSPSGIASLEAFGAPQLNLAFTASGIASVEAFGNATVTTGATISAGGIPSAEAFGSATVSLAGIFPTGIASAETFGSAVVRIGVPVVIELSASYVPSVALSASTISLPGLAASYIPTVALSASNIPLPGLSASYTPVIELEAVQL